MIKDVDRSIYLERFERELKDLLCGDNVLDAAMRYATLDGGKRVRPTLVYLGAVAAGGEASEEDVIRLALAIELIHSYSLVHDDLPAMDDDAMRRGKPTVHKAFGEAYGVLTGDLLLSYAMKVLLDAPKEAAKEIANGAIDMVYGQQKDIEGAKTEEEFLAMYAKKTGAMFVGAVRAGAIASGADGKTLASLTEYANRLGLAFQLSDDLIEDKDEASLVTLAGRDRVRELLLLNTELAKASVSSLAYPRPLIALADKLQSRTK